MPATTEVPTWQILATAGGHFQWSLASGAPDPPSPEISNTPTSRLPSMTDLLREAPSKLLELDGDLTGGARMFKTGSGKSVAVQKSSILKARTVIEGEEARNRALSKFLEPDGGDPTGGAPMFKTGLGKSVAVQKSSILKARTVLDGEEATNREDGDINDVGFPMFGTGLGKSVTTRQSSIRKVAAVLREDAVKGPETVKGDGGNNDGFPMFRTGSGQSVMVRQSSVRKAAAVLDWDSSNKGLFKPPQWDSNNFDVPMFQTGSGKSVMVKQSSINRAVSVLQGGDGMETDETCKLNGDRHHTFSNSLFQTGSGKSVNISSAGISRATTLLGLEGNNNLYSSKYFEHAINQSDSDVTDKWDKTKCGMTSHTGSTYNIDPEGAQLDRSNSFHFSSNLYSVGNQPYNGAAQNHMGSEVCTSDFGHPPLKFQTAGGKSLSISSDALNRARSLLSGAEVGCLQNIVTADESMHLVKDGKTDDTTLWNKENVFTADISKHQSKHLPPNPSFTNRLKSSSPLSGKFSRVVHSDQVKANGFHASTSTPHLQEPHKTGQYAAHSVLGNHGKITGYRNSVTPLADISNNIHTDHTNMNGLSSEKKRPQRRSSISPFKRPRVSRFTTPVNHNFSCPPTDSTKLSISENCHPRIRVSTHYPFTFKKKTLKDFFGSPPAKHNLFRQLPDEVQHMNPENAKVYRFSDASGSESIGSENFRNMLLNSGASLSSMTNEWVANHYKLIVWKLACFERCYPAKASGIFLTVFNVLEELRYRYEREINYGHRSTLKKILDGDASPASMMVLCISSIYPSSSLDINKLNDATDAIDENQNHRSLGGAESNHATKIQLTDGWYCLDAILDASLSKQLAAGKLFVGQKLRIWGAGLCGWAGPISPLEVSKTVSLLIHINGTYRAHWSSPLGFCKNLGAPLAFRCIKGAGGKVPRTLVGITRIYPVLFKERFPNGGSIVRSERTEKKVLQLYSQRQSNIVESIMSEQHDLSINANDSEEGARIFRILEKSAEPEVLMADMSSEQLLSFSTYQSKQEAIRQSSLQKKIEKALEDAGLSSRVVTPFMRLRVVGLTGKGSCRRSPPKEGIITIWNPTEKQKCDLVEGQIYTVSGLMPLNFGSDILYLQARGYSTIWKPVPSIIENFEPFFTPRKRLLLSNLGEVSLASEFDIAAVVVHVGEVYMSGCQKKQWIFVTDGSRCSSELAFEDVYDCLLAVSFCSPAKDDDSSGLLNQSLAGTTIALYNLVKRPRDPINHLWVAEATENSAYSVCDNLLKDFHLKEAANSARQWSELSSSTIQKLRERVLCIVDGQGG